MPPSRHEPGAPGGFSGGKRVVQTTNGLPQQQLLDGSRLQCLWVLPRAGTGRGRSLLGVVSSCRQAPEVAPWEMHRGYVRWSHSFIPATRSRHAPIPARTPGGAGWGPRGGIKLPATPRGHHLQTRGISLLVTHSQPHQSIIFPHKELLSLLTCLLL